MRNYLPQAQSEKLTKKLWIDKAWRLVKRNPQVATLIAAVLVAAFGWVYLVHAQPLTKCFYRSRLAGTEWLGNSNVTWNQDGFFYRSFIFDLTATDAPSGGEAVNLASDGTCSPSADCNNGSTNGNCYLTTTTSNSPGYNNNQNIPQTNLVSFGYSGAAYNQGNNTGNLSWPQSGDGYPAGVVPRPTDLRLGVPNLTASGGPDGSFASIPSGNLCNPTTIQLQFDVFASAFNCSGDTNPTFGVGRQYYAATADDGLKDTINPATTNKVIACDGLAGAVGTDPKGPAGNSFTCKQQAAGQYHTGYYYVSDNCDPSWIGPSPHLHKDILNGSSVSASNCNNTYTAGGEPDDSQDWWQGYFANSLIGGPTGLRSLIGNWGNGNGNFLNDYTFKEEAFSSQSGGISNDTVITYKYPIPPTLQVWSQPGNPTTCYMPENTTFTSGCGVDLAVYAKPMAQPHLGKFGAITVSITLPSQTYVNNGYTTTQIADMTNGPCKGATSASWNTSTNVVTVVLSSGELGPTTGSSGTGLNQGNQITVCDFANATSKTISSSLQQITTTVNASGGGVVCFVAGCNPIYVYNFSGQPAPDVVNNYIYSPQYPYLTTSLGDVHAGGAFEMICGSDIPNAPASINGQSNGGSGGLSKGDYVVSAAQNVSNVTNFNSGANNELTAATYYGVCRPNLIDGPVGAKTYEDPTLNNPHIDFSGSASDGTVISGGKTLDQVLQDNSYGSGGMLVHITGDVTINNNLTINRRVTLWSDGNIIIKGNISEATTAAVQLQLASFGAIAKVTIGFVCLQSGGCATNEQGFFYAQGQINTCTNAVGTPWTGGPNVANLVNNCGVSPLVVTGLMSAQSFSFARTAPLATKGPLATETVNYTGLFFIAPPPVFDDSVKEHFGPQGPSISPPLY